MKPIEKVVLIVMAFALTLVFYLIGYLIAFNGASYEAIIAISMVWLMLFIWLIRNLIWRKKK